MTLHDSVTDQHGRHALVEHRTGCFIDNVWHVGEDAAIQSVDPTTEQLIGETRGASSAQVAAALRAARSAFDRGQWPELSAADRSLLLHRLADLMERDRDRLVEILVAEAGTPIELTRSAHVDIPIRFLRWFADAALRGPRDGYEEALPLHEDPGASSLLIREPAGVVAAITAYNYPIHLAIWKLGPALAAGCTAVLIPSPKGVLSTTAFVRLIEEAEFPAGVVNLVFGTPDVTRHVVGSDAVDLVSFTGSSKVGVEIMALAARTLKRVVLELGGKSPNILLPGIAPEPVIAPSVLRFCRNAGQGCGATTRIFVSRPDLDRFLALASEFADHLTVGDPRHEATDVGPVISAQHRANIEGFLTRALEHGAEVVCGGGRPEHLDRGYFLQPTLIRHVDNDAEVAQEELFAPVGVVIPYDDVLEAVELANATRYGLNASVWGPTPEAIRVARRLRSGSVSINGGGAMRLDAPWGGYRQSGIGREGGEEGFREFFEVKHLQWPLMPHPGLLVGDPAASSGPDAAGAA